MENGLGGGKQRGTHSFSRFLGVGFNLPTIENFFLPNSLRLGLQPEEQPKLTRSFRA